MARDAGKEWAPAVRNSGAFVKHVVPAAVKPLHSLWHQFLAFIFLGLAGYIGFKMWKDAATTSPFMMAIVGFLAFISAGYGISSILKARRISRS
jgi:predicted histidine transporter YuiF (NhaC family)